MWIFFVVCDRLEGKRVGWGWEVDAVGVPFLLQTLLWRWFFSFLSFFFVFFFFFFFFFFCFEFVLLILWALLWKSSLCDCFWVFFCGSALSHSCCGLCIFCYVFLVELYCCCWWVLLEKGDSMCVCVGACVHACMHVCIRAHACTYAPPPTPTPTHMHVHAHAHTHTHSHSHPCSCTQTSSCQFPQYFPWLWLLSTWRNRKPIIHNHNGQTGAEQPSLNTLTQHPASGAWCQD